MKSAYGAASLLLFSSLAWGVPRQSISGTFEKGPAIGGRDREHGAKLIITGETATGSVSGGLFSGSAESYTRREVINFAAEDGEFHIDVAITKSNGDKIVIALDGLTTGVTPTAAFVSISGTWKVKEATGFLRGLKGEGTFSGTEDFTSGVTNGSFDGKLN